MSRVISRRGALGAGVGTAGALLLAARAADAAPITLPSGSTPAWLNASADVFIGGAPMPASPTADVTAWLQAAISQVNPVPYEEGGGVVYLPARTYRISAPLVLRPGVHLRGDGTATVLAATINGLTMIVVPHSSTQTHISQLRLNLGDGRTGCTGIAYGDTSTTPPAWWAHGETPHRLERVWIHNNTGIGVRVNLGAIGVQIDTVHVRADPAAPGTAGFRIEGDQTSLTGCSAWGHANHGITITPDATGTRVDDCLAVSNTVTGVKIAGPQTSVSATVATQNPGNGVRVEASRTVLNGVAAVANNAAGIDIAAGLNHLVASISSAANPVGIATAGTVAPRLITGTLIGNTTAFADTGGLLTGPRPLLVP